MAEHASFTFKTGIDVYLSTSAIRTRPGSVSIQARPFEVALGSGV